MDKNKKSNPKFLLVEPNDYIRKALRKAFQKSGYYIIAVDSADHGRQILDDDCFDMVISDFDLYDGTGADFLKVLKDVCSSTLTVLMVTYGDVENHSEIRKNGIDHVIEKPFLFEKLLGIVKGISEQKLVA